MTCSFLNKNNFLTWFVVKKMEMTEDRQFHEFLVVCAIVFSLDDLGYWVTDRIPFCILLYIKKNMTFDNILTLV